MSPLSIATSRSFRALETGQAKLWLLLVGVNKYHDERFPTLRYSATDCQGLTEALAEATQDFPQKEAAVYHDFASRQPTLANLYESLNQIVSAVQPQDTILFYFSGHGVLEPNTQEVVLSLADTELDNLLHTGLPLQELLQIFGSSQAHQQLIWLDTCHSGSMTLLGAQAKTVTNVTNVTQKVATVDRATVERAKIERATIERATVERNSIDSPSNLTLQMMKMLQQRAKKSKGFYALLSCDTDQQSWEFPELGHGVFTYFLMRGLRGEAADNQGTIDADGLYRYVYRQTIQYIEQTNQQLRLINQQKSSRGENRLYAEYPIQTPKRIVEGVGELVIGLKPTQTESLHPRKALIVEGMTTNKTTLDFCKILRGTGAFELNYFPQPPKNTLKELKQAIQDCLKITGHTILQTAEQAVQKLPANLEMSTILLYLHGQVEESDAGDAFLVLGEDIRLSRSWLRQQLRHSSNVQQIIILDFPGHEKQTFLQDWVDDLQLGLEQGQCIIAASSPAENREKFLLTLYDTLSKVQQSDGLTAAGWITQLQTAWKQTSPLHIWLSGAKGVIEILPVSNTSRSINYTPAIDLGICPYRGLRAFDTEDSQYFYGREELTKSLIQHLSNQSFLAVVGASGSGKSSLVQAGLIAQLRKGILLIDDSQQNTKPNTKQNTKEWWIKTLRPGTRPLEELMRKIGELGIGNGELGIGNYELRITNCELRTANCELSPLLLDWLSQRPEPVVMLVIDQFEELFTLANKVERECFLEIILGALEFAPDKFKVVITLRADFIAACLEIPTLAKFLQKSSVLVPPCLTKEEYRQVIVSPAEQVGLNVDPQLVEVLLQELHQSPGNLSLLEFVLEQLWEFRSCGELTLKVYQQHLGGIKGALETKAQAVYDSLDPEAQECARWIFLSLTQLGEGTEDTRRRILKSELVVKKYPAKLVERTLASLTTAKLVVVNLEEDETSITQAKSKSPSSPSSPSSTSPPPPPLSLSSTPSTVEVAHEVLIRYWSTLRWWLEENRARLRSQRQIEDAAALWKHNNEGHDFLLQGVRLAEAEDIYIHYTDELSSDVQLFIAACLDERQRLQDKEKSALKKAKRAVAIISFLGLTAFGFAGLAFQQSQRALLKEIQALNSLSENYLLSGKQLEALVTSVKMTKELQSINFYPIPADIKNQTKDNLQASVYSVHERNRLLGHNSWVSGVKFSPDGKIIATAGSDSTIKIWGRNGSLLRTLRERDGVNSVNFSPDGNTIISASVDNTIKLWSLEGKLLLTLNGHTNAVNYAAFSPDGQMIVSASDDNTIVLWSREGKLLHTLSGHTKGVNRAIFSPDGSAIASASDDDTIKLWSRDGKLLKTLKGHTNEVLGLAWSPDGKKIASASGDHTVKVWNKDGNLLHNFTEHKSGVRGVSFSPDGKLLASVGTDKTIKISTLDGNLLHTFSGHNHVVNDISFSPDGKTIASASDDHSVRLWDLNNVILPKTLFGHNGGVTKVLFSPDGSKILSAGVDETLKTWSLDGQLLKTEKSPIPDIVDLGISPDGNTFALTSIDNRIQFWKKDNTETVSLISKSTDSHSGFVLSMTFSPDGKTLASASKDKTAKLWTLDGRLLTTLTGHNGWVNNVKFSPDGKTIATASADKSIKLWSSDGRLLKTLQGNRGSIWGLNFSPDGKIIASGSQDGTVTLWSREGKLLKTLSGHSDSVGSVNFSPDGKIIVSASDDQTIKLWSVESGSLLKTLEGHKAGVSAATFSPNGRTLVSASGDETVKIWNLEGIELQTMDLNQLLIRSCKKLHDYLTTNSQLNASERKLCDK